jgi:hypothetical protein
MKTYTVRIYYSTFCTHTVQAGSECEAIEKARLLDIDDDAQAHTELLSNLDHWGECDEAVDENEEE